MAYTHGTYATLTELTKIPPLKIYIFFFDKLLIIFNPAKQFHFYEKKKKPGQVEIGTQ